MQVGLTDKTGELDPRRERQLWPGFSLPNVALHTAVAAILFAALLVFYSRFYSVHQDLAGSALSGKLAVTLGDAFRDYSIYFPPAEKFWFSIAARLADWTGFRLDLVVVAMTGLAVLFSTGFAYRIRRLTVGASPSFLILSVVVLLVVPILFKNVFGLREHMVALGMWPYLVLRLSDPEGTKTGRGTQLLVGLWMGATLLFKYLYAIAVFLIELADAATQRRLLLLFRIENLVAGAIVGLYLFLWLGIDPAQRAAIGSVFSAIDANLANPATNMIKAAKNSYFALLFLLVLRIFRAPARVAALGLALVAATVIVAWSQERWYSHHLFAIAMAYIAWWWMAAPWLKWFGHLVVPIYLALPVGMQLRSTRAYQLDVDELGQSLDQSGLSVAGKRVGILTMHPSPYNQVLASRGGTRWNVSMNNSYAASELRWFDKPEYADRAPPPIKLKGQGWMPLHDELLRLWEDQPPDVLILDHSTRWPLIYTDVEWTHIFSEDPRFNAVLSNYRPVLAHKGRRLEYKYYARIG